MMQGKIKLLFLVADDYYFCSHRLPLALAAKEAGYEVLVATHANRYRQVITDSGLQLIDIESSRGKHFFSNSLRTLKNIFAIYKIHKPDIVHHVSLRCVFLGSIIASLARVPHMVNALTGMGFVFTSRAWSVGIIKATIVIPVLKFLFMQKNSWVILQNADDKKLLDTHGVLHEDRLKIIRGSGVDIDLFKASPEKNTKPMVVLASRMLADKGVREFVMAARMLKERGVEARFALVGDVDLANPMSLQRQELEEWQRSGVVEWWGHRDDMDKIFSDAHVVCLPPLYREGLPKVLLEAAASGRAIVTTDVPGCREIVQHGINGLLVPPRDAVSLAQAIEKLLNDRDLRQEMGRHGRKMVEEDFSLEIVNRQTLNLYERVLNV